MSRYKIFPLYIILSLLYGAIALFTPPLVDDLMFMGDSCGVGIGFSKLALGWQELRGHFIYDVGRLSNMIAVVFLCLFPRIIFAIFQSIAVYIILEFGARLLQIQTSFWRILYAFFFVFALPWHDSIAVLDYSINYVWSTAFIVATLYIIFRSEVAPTLPYILVIFSAGWMHESFSVPVCGALTCAFIAQRQSFSRRMLIFILIFICGTAMNFVFPGIWHRAASTQTTILSNLSPIKMAMTCFVWISPFACILAFKKTENKPLAVTMFMSTILAFFVYAFTGIVRGMWICQFYGIISTIYALRSVCSSIPALIQRVFYVASTTAMLASLLWSIVWTIRFNEEYRQITSHVLSLQTDHIYKDTLKMSVFDELFTFGRVKSNHFRSKMDLEMFGSYFCQGRTFKVLPAILNGNDMSKFQEMPDNPGIFTNGKTIVANIAAAQQFMTPGYKTALVEFANGHQAIREIIAQPFSDIEGKKWAHLMFPRRYGYDSSPIVRIEEITL